jgi:uncharacterized protein
MDKEFRECCFKTIPSVGKRLIWEITHECSMGCDYCFQEKKRAESSFRVIDISDLLKICSLLPKLDISDVLITGGEIFNAKNVIEPITTKLKELNLPVSFSTSFFRDGFINFLLSLKPKSLNISLDPRGKETEAAYENILKNITNVLKLGEEKEIQIKITGVINKHNVHNVELYIARVKKMISEYKCLKSVYITNPYDIGFIKADVRSSEACLKEVIEKIKINKRYSAIKFVNFHRLNMPLQRCYAGIKFIHMEPNGDVYPCHLFANLSKDHFMMGNVLKDNIEDINSHLKYFSNQTESAIIEYKSKNSKCEVCKVNKECGGGCLAEIISVGNLIEPNLICKEIPAPKPMKLYKPVSQTSLDIQVNGEDLTQVEEDTISEYVKGNLRKHRDLAHGYDHICCVVKLARFIGKKEGANLRIITAAAYFHDFEPRQKLIFESHTKLSAYKAVTFLKKIPSFNAEELDRIYHCIDTSSYGSAEVGHIPENIEAKVVRDADWLDAIGARGIARVFAFGATHGCETLGKCYWNPENPEKLKMSLIGPDPSPIYHFFSKLLWVKDRMATNTGKKMALVRHQRLVDFLKNYSAEMMPESIAE